MCHVSNQGPRGQQSNECPRLVLKVDVGLRIPAESTDEPEQRPTQRTVDFRLKLSEKMPVCGAPITFFHCPFVVRCLL